MPITTKQGDKGTTSFNNRTIAKDSLFMELIGTIDELSAYLVYLESLNPNNYFKDCIFELNELASYLCGYYKSFNEEYVRKLEDTINSKEEEFKFKYPFDDTYKAQINIARTICRRLERRYIAFANGNLDYNVSSYLNRLSDYIYIFM